MSEEPTYEVGQHVLIDRTMYGKVNVARGVVTKITPTGRVNVAVSGNTYQFKGRWLVGGGQWSRAYLVAPDKEAELLAREAEQITRERLGEVFYKINSKWDKDRLIAELEAALEIARSLP